MKIVIASDNKGKAQELEALFKEANVSVISQLELNVDSVPETGLTFVENAIIKARNCCKQTGMPSVGDDSGLEVGALNNSPGIYSARFAGEPPNDSSNIEKLLKELKGVADENRSARFRCVIVFLKSVYDPSPIICEGVWSGKIVFEPCGSGGFGYDPVFWVPEYGCTAAQLSQEVKNQISHRAKALQKLVGEIKNEK